ncbi:MAG: multiprotein-bridging factor 1 family protein [Candidatus Micrarchaeota archaeon]|nr:multiprotein-bridging factor 1 family protein [Candidatus Micrarchaeota archaeon]
MEDCQICGREAVGEGFVEGAKVPLCGRCMDHATRFDVYDAYKPPKPVKQAQRPETVEHYVEDWNGKLKSAREAKDFQRGELGNKVFISETDIKAFEDGRRKPTPAQLEKLERLLGVSLVVSEIEGEAEKQQARPVQKGQAFTLGDIVKIKKKA